MAPMGQKKSPRRCQKVQKDPKFGRIKNEKIGLYFQTKIDSLQNVFEPDLDPKNNPNGPKKKTKPEGFKKWKKAQNIAELKTKR